MSELFIIELQKYRVIEPNLQGALCVNGVCLQQYGSLPHFYLNYKVSILFYITKYTDVRCTYVKLYKIQTIIAL